MVAARGAAVNAQASLFRAAHLNLSAIDIRETAQRNIATLLERDSELLVLVAFGVFVLPFAFTTPPPIITRFVATRSFTPGNDQGRSIATVAIRLSEPSNVSITIKDPASGAIVARLADGNRTVRARTLAVTWDGRDLDGRQVPDGAYAIDLEARAGRPEHHRVPPGGDRRHRCTGPSRGTWIG